MYVAPPSEPVLAVLPCAFIDEISFWRDVTAFLRAVTSCPDDELDVGGKSRTDVLSTSSIGIIVSISTPLISPFSSTWREPVFVGIIFA